MHIINTFKGIFIGIALVVPGLSGSIIAIVMGLYEDIINAVSDFRHDIKGNIKFLAPIGIGAVIGILASARIVLWLCQAYPLQSYLFFTGLVLGAYPLIFRKMTKSRYKPSYIIAIALGFSFMFIISFIMDTGADSAYVAINSLESASDFGILFAVGAISVSFMMIPGVSGAVMLMVMGHYGTVYNAVGMSVDLLGYLIRGNFDAAAETFATVILVLPFGIGALAGIVFIAKILAFFLNKWETIVYYAVMGLVSGAVFLLISESGVMRLDIDSGILPVLSGVFFLIIGLLCTVFLDKPNKSKE
ncbi:MAG: DUF368 domain-containing protein [Defluviitaleaceae bacterium]|nr:DUF368 domain-containing protein [Defluviitaleaceae bacterium]